MDAAFGMATGMEPSRNKVVGAVPLLNDVQSLIDFTAQFLAVQIAAQKDRFDGLSQFGERLVGRVLDVVTGEAPQDGLGLGGAEPDGRHIFDHLVILLADDFPVDRFGQHQLQVPIGIGLPDTGAIEFLDIDPLQPRHKLEAQEAAEREGDGALAVRIHVLAVNFHLGAGCDSTLCGVG